MRVRAAVVARTGEAVEDAPGLVAVHGGHGGIGLGHVEGHADDEEGEEGSEVHFYLRSSENVLSN